MDSTRRTSFITGVLFDKLSLMLAIVIVSLANALQFFFMLSPSVATLRPLSIAASAICRASWRVAGLALAATSAMISWCALRGLTPWLTCFWYASMTAAACWTRN